MPRCHCIVDNKSLFLTKKNVGIYEIDPSSGSRASNKVKQVSKTIIMLCSFINDVTPKKSE